jgi:two-component system, NarL family, sensor histidine kinase DesK
MADGWLDPGLPVSPAAPNPALTPVLDRSSSSPADERADSGYAVPSVPVGPDDQPGYHGAARGPRVSVMTEAPAQPRDRTGPVGAAPIRADAGAFGPLPGPGAMNLSGLRDRIRWIFAAIWLVYLAQPAGKLWSDPDAVRRYLGLADLIAFSLVFVAAFAAARYLRDWRNRQVGRRIGVIVVVAQATLVALGYLSIGPLASVMLIYLAVMAVFLLPTRVGWIMVAACVATSLVVPWLVPGWTIDGTMAFQIFISALAAWGVGQVISRNAQLAEARNEITRLALADQRNEFARDLHDILGHSLTVVAVKAELAGRLASLDPQRAETEIADVERIARQALADIRAAAAGYREITLAGELASARTALAAAGIGADLPDQDQGMTSIPRPRQELFSWTVREGVTNVVRHSGASRCRIRVTASEVEISDDGCGPPAPANGTMNGTGGCEERPADHLERLASGYGPGCGHGLAGLRERAAAAGATLTAARSATGGFALRVHVP